MRPKRHVGIIGAMFDVKPVDQTGSVDLHKIARLSAVLDLKNNSALLENKELEIEKDVSSKSEEIEIVDAIPEIAAPKAVTEETSGRDHVLKELQDVLSDNFDIHSHLVSVGGRLESAHSAKPRYRPIVRKADVRSKLHFNKILSQVNKKFYPPISESIARQTEELPKPTLVGAPKSSDPIIRNSVLEVKVADFYRDTKSHDLTAKRLPAEIFRSLPRNKWFRIFSVIMVIGLVTYFGKHGFDVKSELVKEGNSGVQNLQSAGENLRALNFASASYNFTQAYDEFSKAGDSLNFLGNGLSALIGDLPGASKLKSAQNLIKVGKLAADAGKAMSQAIEVMSRSGALLNPSQAVSANIVGSFKEALLVSQRNIRQASILLAEVDTGVVPIDKQEQFLEFKNRLPEFEALVDEGVGYAYFFESLIGKGTKKYLLLFQNYSELRPTGGFAGSYGVVTFENGTLKHFFVDDIYNLDGQLKENIIPPEELQHITPIWGMRDASWFADFPTSAKKASEFFRKEAGYDVDGVITVSPSIIVEILKIVGPIEMPEYKLTLNSDNFLAEIQDEVEYGPNRKQPKQVLVDMAPKLLQKLYTAPSEDWQKIFTVLVASLGKKDMLMYFRDVTLQNFSVERGFSGIIQQGDFDYLMVNISNVKGSKTDVVTDTSLKVITSVKDGGITHRLAISRKHNGGKSEYGFYNKKNPAFIKVLVPEGSTLENISGNSEVSYQPLIDYSKSNFKKDSELAALEESTQQEQGIKIFKESGKTVFGFWLVLSPGETKTVELEYRPPLRVMNDKYQLVIQKQPGLNLSNFEFIFDPADRVVNSASEILSKIGNVYTAGQLEKDLNVGVDFK